MTNGLQTDKIYATVLLQGEGTFVVTLRPGVAGVGRGATSRHVEVQRIAPEIDANLMPVRVTTFIPADPATIDLREAEIVVAFALASIFTASPTTGAFS